MTLKRCSLTVAATVAAFGMMTAPAFAAAPAVATPSLSYTVDGLTVHFTTSIAGQEYQADPSLPVDGSSVSAYELWHGDESPTDWAKEPEHYGQGGDLTCLDKGPQPMKHTDSSSYTYDKPGTYQVKVAYAYCTGPGVKGIKWVWTTQTIVVPGKTTSGTTTDGTTTDAATPSKPAPATARPAKPVAPVTSAPNVHKPGPVASQPAPAGGPKVETDYVADDNGVALAAAGAFAAAGAAGVVLGRRRNMSE